MKIPPRSPAMAAACARPRRARAQAWNRPEPVKLIVPYPAGGNSDIIGRFIAEGIAGPIGQQIVVETRAGAGATIGAQAAARSPADGYTLFLAPTAVLAITPHLRKVPYDPELDLVPIAKLSGSYGIGGARMDLPAKNMAELIALAQGIAGQAHLRFGRHRHDHPPDRRDRQQDHRHQHAARAVQGLGTGAERPHGRTDRPDLRLGRADRDQSRQA